MDHQHIRDRIKDLRIQHGRTLKELGEAINPKLKILTF